MGHFTSEDCPDMKFLLALSLACSVLAQDTYHCPDGWVLEEDRSGCRCFWFNGAERVTRDDASILCSAHDSWVAGLDHPGINYWLKSQLLNMFEAGDRVQWFDWADGEPNNSYGEYCMGMMEVHDPWYFYRDYFWNDLDCDGNHHYICEKKCPQY